MPKCSVGQDSVIVRIRKKKENNVKTKCSPDCQKTKEKSLLDLSFWVVMMAATKLLGVGKNKISSSWESCCSQRPAPVRAKRRVDERFCPEWASVKAVLLALMTMMIRMTIPISGTAARTPSLGRARKKVRSNLLVSICKIRPSSNHSTGSRELLSRLSLPNARLMMPVRCQR